MTSARFSPRGFQTACSASVSMNRDQQRLADVVQGFRLIVSMSFEIDGSSKSRSTGEEKHCLEEVDAPQYVGVTIRSEVSLISDHRKYGVEVAVRARTRFNPGTSLLWLCMMITNLAARCSLYLH